MTYIDDLAAQFGRALKVERKSPQTIRSYAICVSEYLRFAHIKSPDNITRQSVMSWLADLTEQGAAPATIRLRIAAIQKFCKWLLAENLIEELPTKDIPRPQLEEKMVPVLSPEEIKRLIKSCQPRKGKPGVYADDIFRDRRDEAIIRLLLDTGMRVAELCAITLDDLNSRQGLVIVNGKGSRKRVIGFSPETAQSLDRYLRQRVLHPRADSTNKLFIGQKGKLTPYGVRDFLEKRGNRVGIPNLYPHMFRHTWAHSVLLNGMQERDVMTLAGWRSHKMLERYGNAMATERALEAQRRLYERNGK